ncbi:MAG: hypothetical protein V7632_5177 [Bradyrhizobium sp.]
MRASTDESARLVAAHPSRLAERRKCAARLAPQEDLVPVALVARSFNVVVVNPASPVKSIADLIAAAKADPEKLS